VRERLDGNEILISLALLGEATKDHLLGFHFPGSPLRRIERHLQPLVAQGLIERRTRYTFDTQRNVPVPNAHAYRLSARGHELVSNDPRYPVQTGTDEYRVRLPNPDTTQVQEHDLLGSEAISWLVVLARRGGLSGMFLRREQQLDPQARAPRIDAVLVLHFGGPQLADGAFVWTKNPPSDEEQSLPLALEIDRNTEAISIIRGKALRYKEALDRERTQDYWEDHYGRTPIIVWIAPTERRLEAIHRVWREAWPEGNWVLATIGELSGGRCWIYQGAHDTLSLVRLFSGGADSLAHAWPSSLASYGFDPPPALPPPPPALPPPPPALQTTPVPPNAPEPRIIEFCLGAKDAGPPPADEPQVGHLVVVHVTNDPELRWEGYLCYRAPGPLNLGPEFTDVPITIHIPGLTFRITMPRDENPIVLGLNRPAVCRLPEPWEYGSPPIRLRDRLANFLEALRTHEAWAVGLTLFVPPALVLGSVAVWTLAVAVAVAVTQQVRALLAWAGRIIMPGVIWFATVTEPIGGPGIAIPLVVTLVLLVALTWDERARIKRFIEEAMDLDLDREVIIVISLFVATAIFLLMAAVWRIQRGL
jgi:hypothetical protein